MNEQQTMTRDDVMRETLEHVRRVAELMLDAIENLQRRAVRHDDSKFSVEEFESFAQETPGLKSLVYGSDEYREALRRIKPAIKHHQANNRHHPEYHAGGFADMNLLDLIEMLADWRAATERHETGDLRKSIELNAERFGYGDDMKRRLYLTAAALGWCA